MYTRYLTLGEIKTSNGEDPLVLNAVNQGGGVHNSGMSVMCALSVFQDVIYPVLLVYPGMGESWELVYPYRHSQRNESTNTA